MKKINPLIYFLLGFIVYILSYQLMKEKGWRLPLIISMLIVSSFMYYNNEFSTEGFIDEYEDDLTKLDRLTKIVFGKEDKEILDLEEYFKNKFSKEGFRNDCSGRYNEIDMKKIIKSGDLIELSDAHYGLGLDGKVEKGNNIEIGSIKSIRLRPIISRGFRSGCWGYVLKYNIPIQLSMTPNIGSKREWFLSVSGDKKLIWAPKEIADYRGWFVFEPLLLNNNNNLYKGNLVLLKWLNNKKEYYISFEKNKLKVISSKNNGIIWKIN